MQFIAHCMFDSAYQMPNKTFFYLILFNNRTLSYIQILIFEEGVGAFGVEGGGHFYINRRKIIYLD